MNKRAAIMILALLLSAIPATAGAWRVQVVNETGLEFNLKIYGSRVFWNQVDCDISVGARSEGNCQMPFLICPIYADATYLSGWKLVHTRFGLGPHGTDIIPGCSNRQLRIFPVERLGHVYIEYEVNMK